MRWLLLTAMLTGCSVFGVLASGSVGSLVDSPEKAWRERRISTIGATVVVPEDTKTVVLGDRRGVMLMLRKPTCYPSVEVTTGRLDDFLARDARIHPYPRQMVERRINNSGYEQAAWVSRHAGEELHGLYLQQPIGSVFLTCRAYEGSLEARECARRVCLSVRPY